MHAFFLSFLSFFFFGEMLTESRMKKVGVTSSTGDHIKYQVGPKLHPKTYLFR